MAAEDNSRYYSFEKQSTSNIDFSGMQPSYVPSGESWTPGESKLQYTGHQPKPGFPNKPQFRQRPKKQPSQPQILYCDICRISCAGPQPYSDHLAGQKHKKKEAALALQQKLENGATPVAKAVAATTSRLYCELCDLACGSADTFASHVRGVKHQRVVNLHTMMGKPVPNVTATEELAPAADAAVSPTPASASGGPSLTAANPVTVPASVVATTSGNGHDANLHSDPTDASEKSGTGLKTDSNEFVGTEFIEEVRNDKGVIVSYNCRLCECSFTDPNAKRVHLNGRRHRLQYKKKIDTTLKVETKPSLRTQKIREERLMKQQAKESYWKQQDMLLGMRLEQKQVYGDFAMWQRPRQRMGPRQNTADDRYVLNKHMDLYPPKQQMVEIHSAIMAFENALKLVSDVIAAEDGPMKKPGAVEKSEQSSENECSEKTQETAEQTTESDEKESKKTDLKDEGDFEQPRLVRGAMRVGLLSKGLMLVNDIAEHLIVVCAEKPTESLLQRIVDLLPTQLATLSSKKFNIETCFDKAGLFVTIEEPSASFNVTLTSTAVIDDGNLNQDLSKPDPVDLLSQEHCVSALALLRHTKWFQVRLSALKAATVVVHVLRDFCQRNPVWKPLSEWAQELLVEKCIFAAGVDIGPGEALRGFFECISSGILLPGGHGVMDPCEKAPNDATADLTQQQREDLTASAQHFLRMIVFRQMHKILNVEPFKRWTGKRKRGEGDKSEIVSDEKKQREDESTEDCVVIAEESSATSDEKVMEKT